MPAMRANAIVGSRLMYDAVSSLTRNHAPFSSSSIFSRSRLTQYHALMHPTVTPARSRASVHEKSPGCRRSNQSPRAIPIRVGTTMDQPTMPNILIPTHRVLSRVRRARALRASLAPIRSLRSCGGAEGGSSGRSGMDPLVPFDDLPDQTGLQAIQGRSGLLLFLIQLANLLAYGLAQLAELPLHGIPGRDQHLPAVLHEEAFVDGEERLCVVLRREREDAGDERRHEIDVPRQEAE